MVSSLDLHVKLFMILTNSNSTDISLTENTRVTFCDLELYAASIPTEHLHTFDVLLRDELRRIADSGLDMQRMRMVIERERRKVCVSPCRLAFF